MRAWVLASGVLWSVLAGGEWGQSFQGLGDLPDLVCTEQFGRL
ncbi:MAG: hypothetical protein V2A79_00420 [Planctomycetota bacterium]